MIDKMNKRSSYRPDIDGLRAVAVLLVVGFHAFPNRITGGYVGVDIFFVISGFLITGLLLQDLESKEFSFWGFYSRRIRRIFPALITVLIACFVAGWLFLLPRELAVLGLNIFGGAAFSSNLVLLKETNYFDLSAAQPLLHLWSLGVEEQFYIVWPILLLLAFSRRVSVVFLAIALLGISFAWNVKDIGTPAGFYLPFTRAWELMIGGIMAALASRSDFPSLARMLNSTRQTAIRTMPALVAAAGSLAGLRALIGGGLIAVAVVFLDQSSQFPGWWALLPTVGAALIMSAQESWINRTILSHPIAVLIGLMSYPLYLWHWPLLSFANTIEPEPSRQIRLAAVVAAVALAWITYRWIEQPIRTGQYRALKIAGLCVVMTLIGGVGLAAVYSQGFILRLSPELREIASIEMDPDFGQVEWRAHTCFLHPDDTTSQFTPDCLERGRRPLLFLWGDSNAAALYPGLKHLQATVNFGLAQYTSGGCPPLPSFIMPNRPNCFGNNKYIFDVLSDARPEIVLLYAQWTYGEGDTLASLAGLIAKLRLLKIPHIIVMGPPPAWKGGLPKAAYDYYKRDHQLIPARSSFRVDQDRQTYEQEFHEQVVPLGVEYISSLNALCDGDECLTRVGDSAADLTAFDESHLTVPGSIYLAQEILPCLFSDRNGPPQAGPKVGASVCFWPGEGKSDSVKSTRWSP